jgi:predicted LPLAT superfamily acyltransferase
MSVCAVIPSRNHYAAVRSIVQRLRRENLFVFIVDDGSDEPARTQLAALHDPENGVEVRRFDIGRGKGAAVVAAMQAAIVAGFTHALQVDADGQHELTALPRFLELAVQYPEALICGRPVYDASVPVGRRIGRWITHIWVWIETLSLRIADSMCGFRLYPLKPCATLFAEEMPGRGMEFDTDIIVRLFWRGVAPIWLAVQVSYPPDNVSNFNMLRDNWRITKMHTRLFFTMLLRLPSILVHRPPHLDHRRHWAMLPERGVYLGMKFSAMACRMIGRGGQRMLIAPIVLYFYLSGRDLRRASRVFLTRALHRPPTRREQCRHFMNFGMRAVDVFLAWTGKLSQDALQPTDKESLVQLAAEPHGCLLVVAHLGNVEVVRALVDKKIRERVTVLVHTRHAVNFNRIIGENAGDYADNLFQVTAIGPETVIALKERLDAGGMIVIAGDRTPVLSRGRSMAVPFFGQKAPFPEGPWILAALLDCPVYLMHCPFLRGRYRLTIEQFSERIVLPRQGRDQALREIVTRYAARLEEYCAAVPLQWYNFYDFWGPS